MSLTESKRNLAKLLAQENIIVEERASKNNDAFFDTNNRLLVIPVFKQDVSADVVDLMISHEVGHALITEADPWENAIIEKHINKTILNVVEDKRVEDHVKRKYPGLRSVFARGYKELMKLDFFGLSKVDIEEINLVDKINIYTKVGFVPGINFTPEEQEILEKVEKVSSFDDVIKVSDEIQTHMRKVFSKKFKASKDDILEYYELGNDYGTGKSSGGGFGSGMGGEASSPLPFTDTNVDHEFDPERDYTKFEYSEEDIAEIFSIAENDYLQSKTDINFKNMQTELYDDDTSTSVYVDVGNEDMKKYIVGYKKIYSLMKTDCPEIYRDNLINNEFETFKRDNTATVNHLLKEFRLKKNAIQRKKVRESKSGDININKLYSYQVNNDIFKKNIKVSKEQSHSMIFFLDWSASMSKFIEGTIKQLLSLVLFCKKQNIPFEVYAFTSEDYFDEYNQFTGYKTQKTPREMILAPFALYNLLSSKMNNVEFTNAANILLKYRSYQFRNSKGGYICDTPRWTWLHSTPLNHAIIASRQISEDYKVRTGTDIVNNIFLTDGESHSITFKYSEEGGYSNISTDSANVYIRDKQRGLTQKVSKSMLGETNSCLDLVKQSSDIRIFGIRMIDYSELKRRCYDLFGDLDYRSHWAKMKKEQAVRIGNNSYDEFYMIRPTDDEFNEIVEYKMPEKMTVAAISKAFSKSIGGRIENKVILNKFIDFIS